MALPVISVQAVLSFIPPGAGGIVTAMQVDLVSITSDAERVIEAAARTCYQSGDRMTPETIGELLPKLLAMGHESPFEHASATFRITGCSRAMTHQLVRHRLMSVCQKSQRYVREDAFDFVVPPSIPVELHAEFEADMEQIRCMYRKWVGRGIPKEDARFVLPNACASELMITANFREFRHIFRMRCDRHAQWEIREACTRMLQELHRHAPHVFADLVTLGKGDGGGSHKGQ
jgi:thymidylate synthase (FAD)